MNILHRDHGSFTVYAGFATKQNEQCQFCDFATSSALNHGDELHMQHTNIDTGDTYIREPIPVVITGQVLYDNCL